MSIKKMALKWPALLVILLVYLILGYAYATLTPDWQSPDEPAHYNYIRQLAEDRQLPVIVMGDWNTGYQSLLVGSGFDPTHTQYLEGIQYEDHQPPLYYLLQVPIYLLSEGDLQTLRLSTLLLGTLALIAGFLALDRLFPQHPWLALIATAFMAFVPQNLAILSAVNNDVLAQVIAALTFFAVITYLQLTAPEKYGRYSFLIGLLVGLAFLSKTTVYFLAGVGGLAILMKGWREKWPWPFAAQQYAAFLLPALILGGLWWGRNLEVYGGTDFLGLQRHDVVAAEQLQTKDLIHRDFKGDRAAYYELYAYTTFHSFWGQFGWMQLPLPVRDYRILLVGCILALAGIPLWVWQERWPRLLLPPQREMLLLFAFSLICVFAAYGLYNLKFVQFQGRYLYAGLIPLGLLVGLGLSGWSGVLAKRWPAIRWLPFGLVLGLAAFAWYALHTYLVPNLPNWQ